MMVDADYKNDKNFGENFESRLVFIGKDLPQDEIIANFKAVSYTHLDVYKRQPNPLCNHSCALSLI